MRKIGILLLVLLLGMSSVYADPNNSLPVGCVDVFTYDNGRVVARGWAYDGDHKDGHIEIQLFAEEVYIGSADTDYLRPDVNEAFSLSNEHGFNAKITTTLEGEHTFYVYAIDVETKEKVLLASKVLTLPTITQETPNDQKEPEKEEENQDQTPKENQKPIGNLEELSISERGIYYKGWAYDPDSSAEGIIVQLYVDGILYDATSTTLERSDVNEAFSIAGNHGFKKEADASFTGTHTIGVYMVDINDESKVLLATKSLDFKGADVPENNPDQPQDPQEPVTPSKMPFVDVEESKWYYDYIVRINELGLMTGTDSTHFSPSMQMTRGMVTTVLYRMAGSPTVEYSSIFADVPNGKFYSSPITWCYQNGIIKGNSDGTFLPGGMITRQELVIMLRNYVAYLGIDTTSIHCIDSFPDVKDVSSWAVDSMNWAVSNKLISGDNGNLNPRNGATRAQCAKMLLAVNDLIEIYTTELVVSGQVDTLTIENGVIHAAGKVNCNQEQYHVELYVNDTFVQNIDLNVENNTFDDSIEVKDVLIKKVEIVLIEDTYATKTVIGSKTSNNDYSYTVDGINAKQTDLHIHGWIYDINNKVNASTIVVKANNQELARITTDVERKDVNNTFGIKGNHGFDLTLEMEEGEYEITIYVIDDFGNEIPIGNKSVEIKNEKVPAVLTGTLESYLVSSKKLSVKGAVSADMETDVEVLVYVDSNLTQTLQTTLSNGKYYFNDTIDLPAENIYSIELYACEIGETSKVLIQSIVNDQNPIFCLDTISTGNGILKLSGWAFDSNDVNQPLEIHVYANGNLLGTLTTNLEREDVNSAYSITGIHGYSGSVEANLNGTQTIEIYVCDILGNEISGANKTVLFPEKPSIAIQSTKFIAHRGYSSIAPENTVKAFTLAGMNGFWGCETDVYLTADGQFICSHDFNFNRTTGVNATASSLTLAQIKQLKILNGNHYSDYANEEAATRIPSLQEYLEVCKQYNMVPVIEIKNGPYQGVSLLTVAQIQSLYNQVKSVMGNRQAYFIGFDLQNLVNLRNYLNQLGDTTTILQYLTYTPNSVDLDSLAMMNIGLGVEYHYLSEAMIQSCKSRNMSINTWTLDDTSLAKSLIYYGVESITSNVKLWD